MSLLFYIHIRSTFLLLFSKNKINITRLTLTKFSSALDSKEI